LKNIAFNQQVIKDWEIRAWAEQAKSCILHGIYLAKCTMWILLKCFHFTPVMLFSAPWDRSVAGGIRHDADVFRRVIPL